MVSVSQSSNPFGAIPIFDGEVPRTFSAKATETISGGFLVQISGVTGDVGSHVNTYVSADLKVIGAQDPTLCNGIALQNAGSNEYTTVATRGAYLMRCGEIVSGGALVKHNASGNVANWIIADSGTGTIPERPIGTALTTSTSGTNNYSLIKLNI